MANITETLRTDIALKTDFLKKPSGDLDVVSGLENVREAIYHRLMTKPGSLIHRPDYGVGIRDHQNAPSSLSIYRRLSDRIEQQLVLDPRIESVEGVSIKPDDQNPAIVLLVVRVRIAGYGEIDLKYTPFGEGF